MFELSIRSVQLNEIYDNATECSQYLCVIEKYTC